VDLKSPGIRIEPVITLNGAWELNRVVFDNVRVPCDNRIGEEGKGWEYANFLLRNERLSYAHMGRKRADLRELRRVAAGVPGARARNMLEDPLFAARLAAIEIDVEVLEVSVLRALAHSSDTDSATVASVKIKCTECAQRITEIYMELAGRGAVPFPERVDLHWRDRLPASPAFGPLWTDAYLFERAQTIYGGTTEIQKNILWKQIGR
jgi:alkylation response protein AidB-like acyl-CoA dehydrogenase